jgi:hypothetical protein
MERVTAEEWRKSRTEVSNLLSSKTTRDLRFLGPGDQGSGSIRLYFVASTPVTTKISGVLPGVGDPICTRGMGLWFDKTGRYGGAGTISRGGEVIFNGNYAKMLM